MEEYSIINQITDYIKKQILNGSYKNNERLSERNICDEFNVSRTIVRQAFLTLKNTNWLYSKSKSGTYVSPVDHNEVIENYKARIPLEPQILLMSYPNLDDMDIKELKHTLQSIIDGPLEDYYIYETKLHQIIVHKTNNHYIIMFIESMMETMQRLAALSSKVTNRRPQSIDEWSHIINCLENHDPQGASLWLSKHMLNSFENYLKNN